MELHFRYREHTIRSFEKKHNKDFMFTKCKRKKKEEENANKKNIINA